MMMDDEKTGHKVNAILGRCIGSHHERVEQKLERLGRQSRAVITNFQPNLRHVSLFHFGTESHTRAFRQVCKFFAEDQFQ